MSQPDFAAFLNYLRSEEARPLVVEAAWAAGGSVLLIVLSALIVPGIAYAVYLGVAVFFASILTGVFVSLLERETGGRVLESAALRRWVAGCALVLAFLAAVILV